MVRALAERVRLAAGQRPDVGPVLLGHVDVQQPDIPATLEALPDGAPAVLVPLLLSAGYHVKVDMRQVTTTSTRPTAIAGALGPDARLVEALHHRLVEAGWSAGDVVVLGAAGSSDPGAVADVSATARMLSARLGADQAGQVQEAYLSFAEPRVAEAVTTARQRHPGRRVVVASYLLAPGYFQTLLERQAREHGADVVTQPLLRVGAKQQPDIPSDLGELVLDRYREALASLV
ncbi:sirohydrochlorin chelatase [Nesterenkonia flava]